ncbi:hypothetical protein [Chroococcidiopsis sp. CCMEE 29]|uniref:hypothetical protein n=1 Tax=Chroococcidiopsis sp. CCMEE 29 TaxID=155894 RepID=UPI002020E6E8|nr:hypothetical protein [Chroococcidiopsis sp. CCMEE 29]
MSNTGSGKKLASFNCEVQMWAEFIARCQEKGTTATTVLTELIKLYLDGSLDDLDVNTLDKRFDERVRASVDEYLTTHSLPNQVAALSEKMAFLEGQLTAYSSRSSTKPSTFKKEQDFWFIQERAKYLGVSISANQRIKIEIFANDKYKERHGSLPSTRLYRGTQAFAYPAKDLDILDAAIKGVTRGG